MMRRTLSLAIAIVLGLVFTSASMADAAGGARDRAFVGLWEAIDSFDGSTQLLSITCANNQTCDVRVNDTVFTHSCDNLIGFARGAGSIERDVLSALYCSNLDGTSTLAGTRANEFVMDRRNGTLTNINDDPFPCPMCSTGSADNR